MGRKTYVVTGGAGFIGSHLVDELIKRNHNVIIIDNLLLGTTDNENDKAIIYREIRDIHYLEKIHGIFHLGQPSSSPLYRYNPRYVKMAISDMVEILQKCRIEGIPLVFASSSSMYWGNPLPYREDMPIKPFDLYTEVKYICERLMSVYAQVYEVKGIALRLFSVYGEREEHKKRFANIITQMIWSVIRGSEFTIWDDGTQTRDFIYVKDVVRAFIKAMYYLHKIKGGYFDVFNVGTGIATSFNEIVKLIQDLTGLELKIEYKPCPYKNYVRHTQADITKIRNVLKWEPKTSLEKGIIKSIKYYIEHLHW